MNQGSFEVSGGNGKLDFGNGIELNRDGQRAFISVNGVEIERQVITSAVMLMNILNGNLCGKFEIDELKASFKIDVDMEESK